MISKEDIKDVLFIQKKRLKAQEIFPRKALSEMVQLSDFALVVSGIRRCGKSTFLTQLMGQEKKDFLFLNFDTPKLYSFEFSDFKLLDEIIKENEINTLYFDEIQVIEGWEIYVRGKLDEGFKVVVTGSNASLLSRELGTKLTGRYIQKELFPFSYDEFCGFKKIEKNETSLLKYLDLGGFPQYIQIENQEILYALVNDILYRDIAVRYNIRDEKPLKNLLMYAVANIGNLLSATKLRQVIGVKSTATVLEYLSFLQDTYLISLVPKFAYSYKVQLVNPKKLYFIDTGLQKAVSPSKSLDYGRRFENLVFNELRLYSSEIFYVNENNKECDFVVLKNNELRVLIQVCAEITNENRNREVEGLVEAMSFFNLNEGYMVSVNQRDKMIVEGKTIEVIPFYEFNFEEIFNR